MPYLLTGDEQSFGILVLAGIFCPAFVTIVISRIIDPASDKITRKKKRCAFLITWIIATAIFTLNVKTTSEIESPFAIVFYAVVGLLPAFIVASVFSKYSAVRKSLSSILKPEGHIGWYLFALLIPPAIKIAGYPINNFIGLDAISEPVQNGGLYQLVGLIAVSFFYGLVFTGGLNEETGWTGFALPKLQARFSPFTASIILWFFWILWHIPAQIAGFWNPDFKSFMRALIGTFFARFIFTWLYNKTKGGILTAILLHSSANVSFAFLPATYVHMFFEALLAVVIIIRARMWKKLP